MRVPRFFATVLVALSGAAAALAQAPDLSGHWSPEPNVMRVTQARLVDAVTDRVLAAQAARDAYAVRWCNPVGMPALMNAALDIRQTDRYMIIAPETHSFTRQIYFDLPPRDLLITDPTSVGQSDGRWDGDTLVVESYAFAGFDYEQDDEYLEVRGVTAIPGGGFRTSSSRLVERFRLTNDGNVLVVEATWTDPKVFREPHTIAYRYHRREPHYEPPTGLYCDPFDEERAEFLGYGESR